MDFKTRLQHRNSAWISSPHNHVNKFLKYLPSLPQDVCLLSVLFFWGTLTNTSVESLGAAMASQQLKWSTIFCNIWKDRKTCFWEGRGWHSGIKHVLCLFLGKYIAWEEKVLQPGGSSLDVFISKWKFPPLACDSLLARCSVGRTHTPMGRMMKGGKSEVRPSCACDFSWGRFSLFASSKP